MAEAGRPLSVGLPRIRNEAWELRDFPPFLARAAANAGAEVKVESGYGSGIGYRDLDYERAHPQIALVTREAAYASDVVLVLRPAADSLDLLRAGQTFVSMLHFPTHKERARRLKELGIDAIALDLVTDDDGIRLVEDMKAVAWNGLDAAFDVLARVQPDFRSAGRPPTRVTVLGAGMVGKHAVEAATKFGSLARAEQVAAAGLPGAEVTVVGRNLSANEAYMRTRLQATDVLVDATWRHDMALPVVPNAWLAELPEHAVVADLAVDLYLLDDDPPVVRGIESIPAGDLDRYVFPPLDRAWDELPPDVPTDHRRWVVSCYGWPGLRPAESAAHYARQLEPLLTTLIRRGGAAFVREDGDAAERALFRASLKHWIHCL